MSGDICETFSVGDFLVQDNGIVRKDGVIVGRLRDLIKLGRYKKAIKAADAAVNTSEGVGLEYCMRDIPEFAEFLPEVVEALSK